MDKIIKIGVALLMFSASTAGAEIVSNYDFRKADTAKRVTLPKGATWVAPEGQNAGYVVLDPTIKQIDLPLEAVRPGVKYRVNIRARIDGDYVVELNDRAHIESVIRRGRYESNYRVMETQGETVSNRGGGFFLTKNWHTYVHVFYTSGVAETITVQFSPNNKKTYIERIAILADDEGGAINQNPDFRYGELNYCGWRPSRDGRLYDTPEGKTVYRSGYYASSPTFPLKALRAYRAIASGSSGALNINYYDSNGKSVGKRFLLRPSNKEPATVEFTPPEGTTSGNIIVTGHLLTALKIEEVDELGCD